MIDRRSGAGLAGPSTLQQYLTILWRRKWLALAPAVALPLVVYLVSSSEPALYRVSADVLVNRQEAATTSLIGQTPALEDSGRSIDTQVMLARVPTVAERALREAGLGDQPARRLLDKSSVYPLSNILRFTVSDGDTDRATRLATAYAHQFVVYRRHLDTVGLAGALAELERRLAALDAAGKSGSAAYARLADRQQQLESLRALATSNVSVVRTADASSTEQIAPRPLRNTAAALVGGVVAGLLLVFLVQSLDTRPRSEEEIEALLGMPVLGRLRLHGARDPAPPELVDAPSGAAADAFHAVRASLQLAAREVDARVVMITSARGGEGAAAVASELAAALARSGSPVALVDLDLRRRSVSRSFDLDASTGVTTLVRGGGSTVADALVAIPLRDAWTPDGDPSGGSRLEVLPCGAASVQPAELVGSPAVGALLDQLRDRAAFVLVAAPPVLEYPDAAAVSLHVDGLVLVVDARRTRRPVLGDTEDAIARWPLRKLGVILTDRGRRRPSLPTPVGARSRASQADLRVPERAT